MPMKMILKMKNRSSRYDINRPTIPHINSETNPPLPMINFVCRYLRQFLGANFGVATLPISCNTE